MWTFVAQGYDIDQQNIQNFISIHKLNHQNPKPLTK
jgi:hypothetical protein